MARVRIFIAAVSGALAVIVLAVSLVAAAHDAPALAIASPGEFVWHDLVTDDPAASRNFYGALFGWKFESGKGVDPGYIVIKQGERPIGGIVTRRAASAGTRQAEWLAYVVVDDVDRAAKAFQDAGGRIYRGPLNARKDLRVAAVADPQGAALGLASRGTVFATPADPQLHDWLWMEYVAQDPTRALEFFGNAIGFRHEVSDTRENFTYHLLSSDKPRAGLFRSLWPREASAWLPYIQVENPAAMAARVTELGGTVLIPPSPRVRNSSLTIVLDPLGAVLALQKYPFAEGAAK